jgi:hypothetical protein
MTDFCKGQNCKRPVLWGKTPEGKKIPLDPRTPVYRVRNPRADVDGCVHIERDETAMVTHFATCPDVGQFGKGKKS